MTSRTASTCRTRVYIAGPLSKGDLLHNVNAATDAFRELMAEGYAPLCPHWSVYAGGAREIAVPVQDGARGPAAPYRFPAMAEAKLNPTNAHYVEWMDVDLSWVEVADALLRLPGESQGADTETDLAESLGIPVYHSMAELFASQPRRRPARTIRRHH